MAVLVGACGTQELRFGLADAGAAAAEDSAADAKPGRGGCSVDTDCVLPTLHCDTSSGQCVACVADDQCGGNYPVCDTALNQCVQCGVDADCHGGRCEGTTHRCIASCADGGLCPRGLACDQASDCIDCLGDSYCSSNPRGFYVCDPDTHQCVQCTDDRDCYGGSTPQCDRPLGRCVECLTSSGCQPRELCDPQSHSCVDPDTLGTFDGGPGPYRDASVGPVFDARP
jgi:hypothetical protein